MGFFQSRRLFHLFIFLIFSYQIESMDLSGVFALKSGLYTKDGSLVSKYPDSREIDNILNLKISNWKPYENGPILTDHFKKNIIGTQVIWIRYKLPETIWKSPCLSLAGVHDIESIYVENQLIYFNNKTAHIPYFDEGLRDWWTLIPLPVNMQGKEIFIKLISEQIPGVYGHIKIGEYEKIIKNELNSDILYFSFSVSLLLTGLLFLFMLIMHKRYLTSDFWLCLLFLSSGAITLTWSKIFFMVLDFSDIIRVIRLAGLSLLPFLFLLFFQSISWSRGRFLNKWLIVLAPLSILSLILIKFKLLSIYSFSFILILLFASSLGIILFTGILEIWKYNKNKPAGQKKYLPEGIDLTLLMELSIAVFTGCHDLLIMQNFFPYSSGLMPTGIFIMMILTAFYLEKNFRKKVTHDGEIIKTLKEKSLSLAGMSHEIRIPLTGIIGMGNLLDETSLSEEQKGYLNIIRSSSVSLLNQINDILDFVKIDSTQMHLEKEPFNLYETIENIMQMISPRAAEQRDEIYFLYDADLPEMIIGDSARTGQVLTNLLGNSVKFSKDGDIELRVSRRDENNFKWIEFKVRDTGIGIDSEKLDKIFYPFSQADSTISKKYGGTGLGLYVSKKLAELMDGSLSAESTPGKGSIFTFRLPFIPSESFTEIKPENKRIMFSRQNTNILIVGEHPGVTVMVDQIVARLGYKSSVMSLTSIHHTIPGCIPGTKTPWDLVILVFDEFCFEKFYLKKFYKDCAAPAMLIMPLNLKKEFKDILQEIEIPYIAGLMTKKQIEEKIDILLRKKHKQSLKINKNKFAEEFPRNILVVDDNPVNRIVVEKMLQNLGYFPDFATNGLQAVNMAMATFYDIIFMDIQMPDKDGITVSREILDFWDAKLTPRIIAMTSDALREDRGRFTEAGLVDCILKPPSMENLQKAIIKHSNTGNLQDYNNPPMVKSA